MAEDVDRSGRGVARDAPDEFNAASTDALAPVAFRRVVDRVHAFAGGGLELDVFITIAELAGPATDDADDVRVAGLERGGIRRDDEVASA